MTNSTLSSDILQAYAKRDPSATGSLLAKVEGSSVFVTGSLSTNEENVSEVLTSIVSELIPGASVMAQVQVKKGLHVVVEDVLDSVGGVTLRDAAESYTSGEQELDEVSVLYQGELPLASIKHSGRYKRENWNTSKKVEAAIGVVKFIAPIVLDRNLQVIDGDLRLSIVEELAKQNKYQSSTVPVIVIDAADIRTDFLRLVLNRSAEFQRWKYDEVDEYVDSVPQAQPLLEPLGFFGERILPESYFGNTVFDYEIHDVDTQQRFYKQEEGLARWAEIRREQKAAEEAAKRKPATKKPTAQTVSLFDLAPAEEDFLPVHDVEAAVEEHKEAMKVVAGTITDNYDKKRRAEKEAKGQAWQTSRRAPKKVVADAKAETEAELEAEALIDGEVTLEETE